MMLKSSFIDMVIIEIFLTLQLNKTSNIHFTASGFRLGWNHLVTILSFAINILMLVTWNAKGSLDTPGLFNNTTAIPDSVNE
jgi:hypothetical protein